ncbi:hypothetical protein COV12_00310 [Candidatus Woesearchaeota archaeon CG10_big_fil_rev_8_21_14_0_10_32_24]|nr:MAG: hypothetical protein COV12_00310 [Candidatus Woesearchaeota archaeon CG10_big_fil_rev_8_21_14_0_10_32_24]
MDEFTQYVMGQLYTQSSLIRPEEYQQKLIESSVFIAGIGGNGCPVTEVLARSGVGRLALADIDGYDVTNLNRQLYATSSTIGEHKAIAAFRRVLDINPHYGNRLELFTDGINSQRQK